MSRKPDIFLKDMSLAIERIHRYVRGTEYRQFANDEKTQDAVIRNLEIIGEAARSVSAELRSKYQSIPWKSLIALRNIVTHEYFGVDLEIIWDIVQNKLPELREQLQKIGAGRL